MKDTASLSKASEKFRMVTDKFVQCTFYVNLVLTILTNETNKSLDRNLLFW